MAKKENKKFVKGEKFHPQVNALNNYWGLGLSVFNDLSDGKACEVDLNSNWVKDLVKRKLIIEKK